MKVYSDRGDKQLSKFGRSASCPVKIFQTPRVSILYGQLLVSPMRTSSRYKEGDPKKLGEVAEYAVPQQPPPIMSSSATNQMRQIPEMLMCLPSLPASQVSCLFISLPVHNRPSCLSWETPQSDCGTVSSENKSVQYARKPVHEKRPDTAGTHV